MTNMAGSGDEGEVFRIWIVSCKPHRFATRGSNAGLVTRDER
jgi:hypothetical protein